MAIALPLALAGLASVGLAGANILVGTVGRGSGNTVTHLHPKINDLMKENIDLMEIKSRMQSVPAPKKVEQEKVEVVTQVEKRQSQKPTYVSTKHLLRSFGM